MSHRQVTPENSIATAGVLGGVTGLLLGGFWAAGTAVEAMGMSWVWVNTHRYHYYSGLFTSINPSYDLG